MGATDDLIAARKAAIARGDKALGREIYHRLQTMGVKPEDIDNDVSPAPLAEKPEPEAATASPPEAAVHPKPRGRPRSSS